MARKTPEELKTELEDLKALKLKQAKALEQRQEARARHALRKQDAHLKIVLGGWLLASAKKTGNYDTLKKALASLSEKERARLAPLVPG